jgi:hypothetical protein
MRDNPGVKAIPVILAAGVLCAFAANASAAPQSFCGTAKGIAAGLVHSNSALSPTGTDSLPTVERKLKASYAAIIKSEHPLLASAPHRIKADLQKTFAFVNYINAKMNAVGWDFTKLTAFGPALVAKAKAATPALSRLSAYFRGTCHIKGA